MAFKDYPKSKIRGVLFNASSYGLYEAFLEAAPQSILQMSIVLRTGHFASE